MSQSDAPGPEESDSGPLDAEEASAEQPAPARNRGIVLVSAAVVVVLVVAGVVIYLMTGDDSTDTANPGVPTIEDSNVPSSAVPAQPPGGTTATITAPSSAQATAPAGEAQDARQVAEQAAQAITDSDLGTLGQLSCDPSSVGSDDTFPADAKVEVLGDPPPQVNGDTATVNVRVTIPNAPAATVPMPLIKKDGRWCIPS